MAVSAPALAHQWARQENAPQGSAVVALHEVAGRGRGGVEWTTPNAVAVSVVARPAALAPSMSEVGWLAASLAAADAINELRSSPSGGQPTTEAALWWPDGVGSEAATVSVLAESILGPGQVDYMVLTVRLIGPEAAQDAMIDAIRFWIEQLDRPGEVVAAYQDRCATIGEVVSLSLTPHGSTRGEAVAVTSEGALLLRSSTGLKEVVPIASTKFVDVLKT